MTMITQSPAHHRLSELLQQTELLTSDQITDLLAAQRMQGTSITESIVEQGLVAEKVFLETLSQKMAIPYMDIRDELPGDVLKTLPTKTVFQYVVVPVEDRGSSLRVATHDPFRPGLRDALQLASGKRIRFALATLDNIEKAKKRFYGVGGETIEQMASEDDRIDINDMEVLGASDIDDAGEEASVIKFVNQIIYEARLTGATDIHIEPMEKDLRIRYRVDGVLQNVPVPQELKRFQDAVIARIKVMAHLDIAEKRLPQDGRISVRIRGEEIDIRVSTAPTVYGESVSLRLLMRNVHLLGMDKLGLASRDSELLNKLIRKPHGIILVTGPTGSGKSTSLYTYLSTINSNDIRIITTEDPVEYEMAGINQIQMKSEIGLTFAAALRSILRQDPDVIMVGEIRDKETAEIAIQAALTGHLVFSTLHTNDAASAVTRLIDMGVEPFLVASSVEALVAQRLVRTLCHDCRTPTDLSKYDLTEMDFPVEKLEDPEHIVYSAEGCEACRGTGYRGRIGIYEVLVMEDSIRPLVINQSSANEIKAVALRNGMRTLRYDGWDKVLRGITTIEEVLRVAEKDEQAEEELEAELKALEEKERLEAEASGELPATTGSGNSSLSKRRRWFEFWLPPEDEATPAAHDESK